MRKNIHLEKGIFLTSSLLDKAQTETQACKACTLVLPYSYPELKTKNVTTDPLTSFMERALRLIQIQTL